jgi:hypothetical protein
MEEGKRERGIGGAGGEEWRRKRTLSEIGDGGDGE